MRVSGPALRLTVIVNESDRCEGGALSHEIVRLAQEAGLPGAAVFHGIEGFGAGGLVHTSRLLSMSEDLPVAIVVVAEEEPVRRFVRQLEELGVGGLIVLDECHITHYVPEPPEGGATQAPS
jgi:PII-like signaling protein